MSDECKTEVDLSLITDEISTPRPTAYFSFDNRMYSDNPKEDEEDYFWY